MIDTLLYFGSFNPIHNGHISIAEYMLGHGFCEELWLIVSPHNPLKEQEGLVGEQDRLEMARIAISESKCCDRIKVSDVEFFLPRPSYTIDTLAVLEAQNNDRKFSILIGSDNVDNLDQWKNYERLMCNYKLWAYPRDGAIATKFTDRVTMLSDAPRWSYSSTEVRRALTDGDDCSQMISGRVLNYIKEKKLWTEEKVYKVK